MGEPQGVIGIVTHHDRQDCGYAILGRDESGRFRVCDLKDHFRSCQEARARLLQSMAAVGNLTKGRPRRPGQ